MKSKPSPQPQPTPDELMEPWHRALHQDYRQVLAEVARLDAQWLLDDRIHFALRNDRQV
jgi:hypothetical protein